MKVERQSIHARLRLGLTFIIALMVISSTTTVMLFNPAQVLAYSRVIENSNDHSNPPMSEERSPSVSSPSTPTIQAPLQIPRTFQSTDIVSSTGIYEVTFITSTTGAIDKIRIDFPADTNIGASGVIERVGIGGGTLTKIDNTLIYDVTTPVSIPAGTFIRLEISGIKNPTLPSNSLTVTITTSDVGNVVIDGPSQTNAYKMKRIGVNDLAVNAVTSQKIADGAITSTKPNESFMKKVFVKDDPAGNAVGWNPDTVATEFTITEPAVGIPLNTFVSISLGDPSFATAFNCQVLDTPQQGGSFFIKCETAPLNSMILQYVVTNLPGNCIASTFC